MTNILLERKANKMGYLLRYPVTGAIIFSKAGEDVFEAESWLQGWDYLATPESIREMMEGE